jgi:DNA-binding SARP family transcriptional activator/TolB-like protein
MSLKLHLLGPFRAVVDGVELDTSKWPRKTARLLVKLLALAPGHKLHREQIAEILSPDADPEAAQNRLHKAIHAARAALEPGLVKVAQSRFILTQDTQVSLVSVDLDVDRFELQANSALQSGGGTRDTAVLHAALSLYTGDLLEEDLYEDWTTTHRERLRLSHQRLLGALSENYEATGDWKTLEIVQRLLAAYPADEEAHRRLMRFYARNGQRHLALDQFKQCSEALDQHMDAAPERATVELYESILDGSFAGGAASQSNPLVSEPVPPQAGVTPSASAAKPAGVPRWILGFAAGLAVAAFASFLLLRRPSTEPVVRKPISLAVLPLRVMKPTTEVDAVADGLTEGLIHAASRLPGLRVMARTTAFAFKNRTDGWQIGKELNVTYVAWGSVDQQEGRIGVNLELVDVADGSRSWGRQYSVSRKDAADLQHLLNSELATALRFRGAAEQDGNSGLDAETYQLYLTGRQFGNERTAASLQRSIEIYQKAIARNPRYARAYAGLADSYGLLGFEDGPPADHYPKAREAAAKALEIDPGLEEAQTSLAMVSALYDWNWTAAEAQFRRAIEMNPGYVTAHHWLGVHLAAMGRFDEAKMELAKAVALDPKSAIVALNYGYPDLYRRRYAEAEQSFQNALALSPSLPAAHQDLATLFGVQQKQSWAASEWVAWLRTEGPAGLAKRLQPLAERGDYSAVLRESLRAFEQPSGGTYLSPMIPAETAVRLDDRDRAFQWLERAFEQRCPQLVYLSVDPRYDSIRSDPRFVGLLRRIGLPVQRTISSN